MVKKMTKDIRDVDLTEMFRLADEIEEYIKDTVLHLRETYGIKLSYLRNDLVDCFDRHGTPLNAYGKHIDFHIKDNDAALLRDHYFSVCLDPVLTKEGHCTGITAKFLTEGLFTKTWAYDSTRDEFKPAKFDVTPDQVFDLIDMQIDRALSEKDREKIDKKPLYESWELV